MRRLLIRIAINGGLTALILAGIGLLYAELAGAWLTSARARNSESDIQLTETLRWRVPLTMAAWGFVFAAVGEIIRSLRRGPEKATEPASPDQAEILLEEILSKLEAAKPNSRAEPTQS